MPCVMCGTWVIFAKDYYCCVEACVGPVGDVTPHVIQLIVNFDSCEAVEQRGRQMTKVLLVEDNEMNRDMLSRRLIRRGF